MKELAYLSARLLCSYEEKTECLQTMSKLSRFLTVARADGFLALEPFLERETNPLIKACLLDILDGLDSAELEQRFESYLAAGDYRGKDCLQAMIILKGFLLLQTCQTPEPFWKELHGYFGADFTLTYREASRLEQTKGKSL